MKKVMLSILLTIFCHASLFACPPPSAVCYDFTTNTSGYVQTITVKFGNSYNCLTSGGTVNSYIQIFNGGTFSSPIANTTVSTIGGYWFAEYNVSSQNITIIPYSCIDILVSFPGSNPFPFTICPCSEDPVPCNANFKYCINSVDPHNYTFSSASNDPWITRYTIDFGDGSSCPFPIWTGTCSFPASHTYPPGTNSYIVCMRAYYYNSTQYCEKCINICIIDHETPQGKFSRNESPNINPIVGDIKEVKLYPNPTSGMSALSFSISKNTTIKIQLIDMYGRIVSNIRNGQMDPGLHNIEIDTRPLPSGMYIIKIYDGTQILSQRLSVTK